jgi:sensor histidine kinase YesM
LFSAVAGFFAVYFYKKLKSNIINQKRMENDIEKYRNNLLKLQLEQVQVELNPHLFKNTLNAIQSYAYKAHVSLDRLGSLLDFILYDSKSGLISVSEEIEFLRNFVELNKLRLNPLFEIRFKTEVDENDTLYTKPLLVPLVSSHLVENAFKHGNLNSKDGFIDLSISLKDGIFYCIVTNKINHSPAETGKGGFGKGNLKKRLEIAYKDYYELTYRIEDNVHCAILKIDLNGYKNSLHIG